MPYAAPAIAIGATLLSSATAATGAVMSASAQRQAADYQAAVAQQNAQQSANAARAALAQGDVAAQQQYQQGAARMGAIKAALGANNIELNGGSALNDQTSQALITGENVANTQYNALAQSITLRNQGASYSAQAGLDTMTGQNASTAGFISAGSSLLGAASQVSSKWSMWQQSQQNPWGS